MSSDSTWANDEACTCLTDDYPDCLAYTSECFSEVDPSGPVFPVEVRTIGA